MRDRDLVRLYWPVKLRPAFDALFDIEDAMADVVVRSTQPALAAIKLAWWRERLEELDDGKVPAEPRLQAAAANLLPAGIAGVELARLEEGWAALLSDPPDEERMIEHGTVLFAIGAKLLRAECDDPTIGRAGRIYARASGARCGRFDVGSERVGKERLKIARILRPLTGLAALAARDLRQGGPPFECEAAPGRAWTLLKHRIMGTLSV